MPKSPRLKARSQPRTQSARDAEDSPARVVVKFKDDAHLPYVDHVEESSEFRASALAPFWVRLQKKFPSATLMRLFDNTTLGQIEQLKERARKESYDPPPTLFNYFYVNSPARINLNSLAKELRAWPMVEEAYVYQPAPIQFPEQVRARFQCQEPETPDHLKAAPLGVDALYAQKHGANGAGVRFADVEQGWFFQHEALSSVKTSLLCASYNPTNPGNRKHGASVLGVVYGSHGIGIAPAVKSPVGLMPHNGYSLAVAIACAAFWLGKGDVLLIEAHVVARVTEQGVPLHGPAEVNSAEALVIRLATEAGVVVVEAGGNGDGGSDSLNLNTYDVNGVRIFNRDEPGFVDSKAIMVSACNVDANRSRLGFAPHGNRIDCYARGEETVTSTNDLGDQTNCYRTDFGGTSSAAAIIAGAAVAAQSAALKCKGRKLLPLELRGLLSNKDINTSATTNNGEHIGFMPNLRNIIDCLCTASPDPRCPTINP